MRDVEFEPLPDDPAAAPVATPAYAKTGRSINPATKARLFPWIDNPGAGLTWSYESNVAPGMDELGEAPLSFGAAEEVVTAPEDDIPESPTRKRLITTRKRK